MYALKQQYNEYYEKECYEIKTGSVNGCVEIGGLLRRLQIGWSLLGESSKPVVVVLGGISANRNVSYDGLLDTAGWWEDFVGKNKAIDTEKFSILSFDYLGSYSSTYFDDGYTTENYISTAEQAKILQYLITELGIKRLHGIVGSSYGGMVSLAFSELFPESLNQQVVISAADKSHPRSTALRQIQRNIVRFGVENGNIEEGLSLARQLGMITYRSKAEFAHRYDLDSLSHGQQALASYLAFNGNKFAKQFNYKAFLCLSESIDGHQINPINIVVPTQLISVDSDELVFVEQLQNLSTKIQAKVSLETISSSFGHDAFLKEQQLLKPIIQSALEIEHD